MAERFEPGDFIYAHRGLWGNGRVENTMAAFQAARGLGLGMEFDVRPSSDGEVIIFHDEDLQRLAGRPEHVEALTLSDLQDVQLSPGSGLPALADLLAVWPGNLPLLTEMKIDGRTDPEAFARKTGRMLQRFPGLAAAMSFSEAAVRALPDGVMRGQLAPPVHSIGEADFGGILRRTLDDGLDYLAVHVSDVARARQGLPDGFPLVTWTVRTEADLAMACRENAAVIFEHLDPALVREAALP